MQRAVKIIAISLFECGIYQVEFRKRDVMIVGELPAHAHSQSPVNAVVRVTITFLSTYRYISHAVNYTPSSYS